MNPILKKSKKEDYKELAEIYKIEFSKTPYNDPWTKKKAIEKIKFLKNYCDLYSVFYNNKIIGFLALNPTKWMPGKFVELEEICIKICNHLKISIEEVRKRNNTREIVEVRHICFYFCSILSIAVARYIEVFWVVPFYFYLYDLYLILEYLLCRIFYIYRRVLLLKLVFYPNFFFSF